MQKLMFLTINIDGSIRLERTGMAKLITHTLSFENQETVFSSHPQKYILVTWREA